MPTVGPTRVMIVAPVALLVLGPRRLPGAARPLGRAIREFRQAVTGAAEPGKEASSSGAGELPPAPAVAAMKRGADRS